MFTIKVVIERIKPQNCLTCSNEGETILDTFVVVNGEIAFNKLVESVLKDLGMPHLINESKGLIQINNWKPLQFEQITDNLQQPITNLLKEISSNLMLKILTKKFVIQSSIPAIVNRIQPRINFSDNYQIPEAHPHSERGTESTSETPLLGSVREHSTCNPDNFQTETTLNISSTTTMKSETNELSPINDFSTFSEITNNIMNFPPTNLSMSSGTSNNDDFNEQGSSFNSRQSNNTGKNRFAFDLFSEVPILDQWFHENPHPNCFQIEEYTNILNEQPFRQTNIPLTNLNVKTWFKNRRARSKLKNLSNK